jgi:hypothetical protein
MLQLPALGSGPLGWDTSQLYNSGTLSVTDTLNGDFNRDGHVTAADLSAMLAALTDLNAYESAKNLTGDQIVLLGDLNGDGSVTNADIQVLLDLLASGNGSAASVPEPNAFMLMGIAFATLAAARCKRRYPRHLVSSTIRVMV